MENYSYFKYKKYKKYKKKYFNLRGSYSESQELPVLTDKIKDRRCEGKTCSLSMDNCKESDCISFDTGKFLDCYKSDNICKFIKHNIRSNPQRRLDILPNRVGKMDRNVVLRKLGNCECPCDTEDESIIESDSESTTNPGNIQIPETMNRLINLLNSIGLCHPLPWTQNPNPYPQNMPLYLVIINLFIQSLGIRLFSDREFCSISRNICLTFQDEAWTLNQDLRLSIVLLKTNDLKNRIGYKFYFRAFKNIVENPNLSGDDAILSMVTDRDWVSLDESINGPIRRLEPGEASLYSHLILSDEDIETRSQELPIQTSPALENALHKIYVYQFSSDIGGREIQILDRNIIQDWLQRAGPS